MKMLLSRSACMTVKPPSVQNHIDKIAKRLDPAIICMYTEPNAVTEFDSTQLAHSLRNTRKVLTRCLPVVLCASATKEKDSDNFAIEKFQVVVNDVTSVGDIQLPIDFPLCAFRRAVSQELAIAKEKLDDIWASIDADEDFRFPMFCNTTVLEIFKHLAQLLRPTQGGPSHIVSLAWVRECVEKYMDAGGELVTLLSAEQSSQLCQGGKIIFCGTYDSERVDHETFMDDVVSRALDAQNKFYSVTVVGFFQAIVRWADVQDAKLKENTEAEY